jgi:hypothetical protein
MDVEHIFTVAGDWGAGELGVGVIWAVHPIGQASQFLIGPLVPAQSLNLLMVVHVDLLVLNASGVGNTLSGIGQQDFIFLELLEPLDCRNHAS